ncbi:MAG: hypothetical protein GX834_01520 [Clostridiaceae bacterium]|nr:hypothetical protein [Clostridiaceae bacterium]
MKKTQQRLLSAVIISIMLISLAACGGGNPLVGKWTPTGDTADSFGASELEMFGANADDMVLEFTKNGKVNMLIQGKPMHEFMEKIFIDLGMSESDAAEYAKEMAFDAEYKVDGDKLTMISNFDGEKDTAEGTFKISGNTLTLTIDGDTETFKKK